jgi:hypothetical protein
MQGVLRAYTGRLTNQNQGMALATSADRIFTTVIWKNNKTQGHNRLSF